MADGFRVDFGALENAAAGVNRTLNDLAAHKVSDFAGSAGDYGHAGLADTAADFCSRWERGVENLAKDGQQVSGRLSMSVQAYLQVDRGAKGMFDGILIRSTGDRELHVKPVVPGAGVGKLRRLPHAALAVRSLVLCFQSAARP